MSLLSGDLIRRRLAAAFVGIAALLTAVACAASGSSPTGESPTSPAANLAADPYSGEMPGMAAVPDAQPVFAAWLSESLVFGAYGSSSCPYRPTSLTALPEAENGQALDVVMADATASTDGSLPPVACTMDYAPTAYQIADTSLEAAGLDPRRGLTVTIQLEFGDSKQEFSVEVAPRGS